MIFQRLIWAALATAVVVGSVQTGVQRWQAAPLILAAEVYEEQKAEAPAPAAPVAAPAAHAHAEGTAPHEHGTAKEWEPENGAERIGWTWVANILHALSMALLLFAVMGIWLYRRGGAVASLRLAGLVAAALLALPFVVGAPKLQGDALAGFGPEAHAALEQLGTQFIWATTWVSLSFWVCLGLVGGLAFQRWVRPALLAVLQRSAAPAVGAVQAPQ